MPGVMAGAYYMGWGALCVPNREMPITRTPLLLCWVHISGYSVSKHQLQESEGYCLTGRVISKQPFWLVACTYAKGCEKDEVVSYSCSNWHRPGAVSSILHVT